LGFLDYMEADDIQLSIAIPTYNRHNSVVSLIKSISDQLSEQDELLVVDDGSTDGTAEIVGEISHVRLIKNSSNYGMVKTWNSCLKHASKEWICIIHDDDNIAPYALDTIRRACMAVGKPAVVSHRSLGVEIDSNFRYRVNEPGAWSTLNSCTIPSGVTVHREIISMVGLFNEDFKYSTDLEYFARAAAKYPSIIIESPEVVKFNFHDSNYEYKTWCKPNFISQLEAIERLVVSYANINETEAKEWFDSKMNAHINHMLATTRFSSDKFLPRKIGLTLRKRPYINIRNRLKVLIAILFNRI
jgi:glycosyltransferase involved in cell wall biosynthesis